MTKICMLTLFMTLLCPPLGHNYETKYQNQHSEPIITDVKDHSNSIFTVNNYIATSLRPGAILEDHVTVFNLKKEAGYYLKATINDADPVVFSDEHTFELKKSIDFGIEDYPCTQSVDGSIPFYTGARTFVDGSSNQNYLQNYENTGNYPTTGRANIIKIEVYSLYESRILDLYLSYLREENSAALVFLNAEYESLFNPDETDGLGKSLYNNLLASKVNKAEMNVEIIHDGNYVNQKSVGSLFGQITKTLPKRGLKVNFGKDLNDNDTDNKVISLFGDRAIKKLRLKNEYGSKFKEPLLHELIEPSTLATRRNIPVELFLNGEFWGLYHIRERYDKEYFKYYYGIEGDSLLLFNFEGGVSVDDVEEGDPTIGTNYIKSFFNELANADLANDDVYDYYFAEVVEKNSLLDYVLVYSFFGNDDHIRTDTLRNLKVFNEFDFDSKQPKGLLRFVAHDLDQTTIGRNLFDPAIYGTFHNNALFTSFNKNERFKGDLLARFLELEDSIFSKEHFVSLLNQYMVENSSTIKDHTRWLYGNLNYISSSKSSLEQRFQPWKEEYIQVLKDL